MTGLDTGFAALSAEGPYATGDGLHPGVSFHAASAKGILA